MRDIGSRKKNISIRNKYISININTIIKRRTLYNFVNNLYRSTFAFKF